MQQHMERNPALRDDFSEIADQFQKNLTLEEDIEHEEEQDDDADDDDDDDDDDGDFEFSFAGSELTSPVSAEEVFQNGQIRPIFPFSDDHQAGNSEEATTSYGPSVRKLFVVSSAPENGEVAEGPYCDWSEKSPEKSAAPEMRRKSNSTGLSKLWRVKDLLVRSHSDGKDAFVFLTGKTDEKAGETASSGDSKKNKKANLPEIKVGLRPKTASSGEKEKGKKKKKKEKSAYETLYGRREKTAGKSYLPYRQDLVGFFTNSNGMTRNVHPY